MITPIGGEIILMGYRFEVASHSFDRNGRPVEVPGTCRGRATKEQIAEQANRNKPTGPVAVVPARPVTHAPTSSRPLTSAVTTAITPTPARQQKARKYKARPRGGNGGGGYGGYSRFQPKPPPLIIHQEPWTAGQWGALIVVLGLIVAGLWLANAGSEDAKWKSIGAAARAVQPR